MEWAKTRPSARFDLAGSNVLACDLDDIRGARDALSLSGRNDNGYAPLMEAIAAHYKVDPACVTTATGAAGANFQTCAALLEPGDEVLMERPGYDPLLGAARLVNARTQRFERTFEDRYALDPDRVRAGITGWAQVHGWRGNTSLSKRIEYDLYYIENWSLSLDIKILWMTVKHGFLHRNAY